MALLTELAEAHGNKLPLDLRGRSWTAATFMAYFKQHISMAIHKNAAAELKNNLRNNVPPLGSARKGRKSKSNNNNLAEDLAAFGVAGLTA